MKYHETLRAWHGRLQTDSETLSDDVSVIPHITNLSKQIADLISAEMYVGNDEQVLLIMQTMTQAASAIYRKTNDPQYVQRAECISNNILAIQSAQRDSDDIDNGETGISAFVG